MSKSRKIDSVEWEKRLRDVQELIIDDWPYTDIVSEVIRKWGIQERQAKRYVKAAREKWVENEQELVDRKRSLKISSLKKLKRSLNGTYKGTPAGIRAVVAVEKEIIKLEGLAMPKIVRLSGEKGGEPIPLAASITHNVNFKKCDQGVDKVNTQ